MDRLAFDLVVVVRVEAREQLSDRRVYEVLAVNLGDGTPDNASLLVTVANSLSAAIGERSTGEWVARAVERRARGYPHDGGKLRALRSEPLHFDSRSAID
jgi:hypothetical protein